MLVYFIWRLFLSLVLKTVHLFQLQFVVFSILEIFHSSKIVNIEYFEVIFDISKCCSLKSFYVFLFEMVHKSTTSHDPLKRGRL